MFRTCLEILEVLFGFQVAWVTNQRKDHFKKPPTGPMFSIRNNIQDRHKEYVAA
jgi:hypothetical protein